MEENKVDKRRKVIFSKLENIGLNDGIFNVEFIKDLKNEKDGKLDGHFSRDDQLIKIDMDIDEQTQRLTVLHEIWHGLERCAKIKLSEEQVEWYSEAMYDFIRSNKEFAKLLLENNETFDIFSIPSDVRIGWRKYEFKVKDEIKNGSWETYVMLFNSCNNQILLSSIEYKEMNKEIVISTLLQCFSEIQKIQLSKEDREELAHHINIFVNDNKEFFKFIVDDNMNVRLQDFILNEYRSYSPKEYAYLMTKLEFYYVNVKRDEKNQLYYLIEERMIPILQGYRKSQFDYDVCKDEDIQVPLHKYLGNLSTVNYRTRWFIQDEIKKIEEENGINKNNINNTDEVVKQDLKTYYEKGYEKDLNL